MIDLSIEMDFIYGWKIKTNLETYNIKTKGTDQEKNANKIELNTNACIVYETKLYRYVSGNGGGYLGLFLGYAVLNVPELVHAAYTWTKEKCMSAVARGE